MVKLNIFAKRYDEVNVVKFEPQIVRLTISLQTNSSFIAYHFCSKCKFSLQRRQVWEVAITFKHVCDMISKIAKCYKYH